MEKISLDTLGGADKRAGGKTCQKNSFEVLDRLASFGAQLSPAQQNDFGWWKLALDDAMLD